MESTRPQQQQTSGEEPLPEVISGEEAENCGLSRPEHEKIRHSTETNMTTGDISGPPMVAFPPRIAGENEAIVIKDYKESQETSSVEVDNNQEQSQKETTTTKFEAGDHVYQWCSVLGIPAFQHHGIVIHVEDIEGDEDPILTIADFSNLLLKDNGRTSLEADDNLGESQSEDTEETIYFEEDTSMARSVSSENSTGQECQSNLQKPAPQAQQSGSFRRPFLGSGSTDDKSSKISQYGGLRVYRTTHSNSTKGRHKWHKVIYSDHWFHTHLWKRSGTCTPLASDPPEVVLKRVHFLLAQSQYNSDRSSLLPKFHSIFANCECVAVWCKVGTWSSLQGASYLSHAAVGQVKATATLGGIAAAQTVSVPASGIMGWFGATTTVPLLAANPVILPALCAYGAVTIGGPAICLAVAKKRWRDTTRKLNQALDAESHDVSLVT